MMGPGMTDDQARHVFDRFYRTDSGRSREGGGGLGLAIARAIVTAHHGTISLHTGPGAGARFTVALPAGS
jgi:two-component system, OmpR family, sensor kinase